MFPNVVTSALSLAKVLSGLSKTIGIVKEAIPLYESVKPMLGNSKKIMNLLKKNNVVDLRKNDNETSKKMTTESSQIINNPVFFK